MGVRKPRLSPMARTAQGGFTFVIKGEPQRKERHRTAQHGTRQITYTPHDTVQAERHVAVMYRLAAGPHELDPPETRYLVRLEYRLGVRRGQAKLKDVDNLVKLTFDGLNKVAWHDDRQVSRMIVDRIEDHPEPCTLVRIEIINPGGKQ